MPVEFCANNCGRQISISMHEGGNPAALANPELFSIEYMVCKDCHVYLCDRCWQKDCPKCGEPMQPGDSMAEALERMEAADGQMDQYLDPQVVAAARESAENAVRATLGLHPETAARLWSPVARAWKEEKVPGMIAEIVEDFAGEEEGEGQGQESVRQELLRLVDNCFLLLPVLGLWRDGPIAKLDGRRYESWLDLQDYIESKAEGVEGRVYRGMSLGVIGERIDMQMALDLLVDECLGRLGFAREDLEDEGLRVFSILAKLGVDLACAQLLAWEEQDPWPLEGLGDGERGAAHIIIHNMLASTRLLDEGSADAFDPARMDAYLQKRERDQDPVLQREARFTRLVLARTCGVDNGMLRLPTMEQAGICLAAQEWSDAYVLYHQAANGGDPAAMYALSVFYTLGLGCEVDEAKRVAMIRKAADLDHLGALADCYDEGLGVAQSKRKYFKYAKKAAEAGDSFAQGGLAMMYASESSLNPKKAMHWASLSFENGNPLAMMVLERMAQ